MEHKSKHTLCDETPADCHFELKTFPKGTTGRNEDTNINYLIYCQSGHVRISSTLFYDQTLHEGEIMFLPRHVHAQAQPWATQRYSSTNSTTPSATTRSAFSRTSTPTGIYTLNKLNIWIDFL